MSLLKSFTMEVIKICLCFIDRLVEVKGKLMYQQKLSTFGKIFNITT